MAAIMVEPPTLFRPLIPGAYIIQAGDLSDNIVHVGLSMLDHQGLLQPIVAEAVPTLENGLWRLLPDGQMELVWKIRPGAEWHDGPRFTADDLVFATRVGQEPSLPEFRSGVQGSYALVERVEAVDPQTVSVTWKKPLIKADRIFSSGLEGFGLPLPRHLLERALAQDRESLLALPFWSREYVGLGPYKLREWVAGSHLQLEANDRYVLGRPKIDEMEVRFILDANTVSANILAGAVDVTLGIALSLEQNLEIRDQWREGKLEVVPVSFWLTAYPQFVNPNPPIVTDLRFRKALIPVADYRQRLGIAAEPLVIPVQRSADVEYNSQFPGFYVVRQPIGPWYVERFHSSEARLPETRFQGRNSARYMNPEFDVLIERYMSTIPRGPRMAVLGQVVHHISDQLNALGFFYDVGTTLVGNRLANVPANNPTSNVHAWDLKS